jgi:fimbrial chaperone protein
MHTTAFRLAAALMLVPGIAAASASFTVDPMQVNLSRQVTSQIVTITNESKQEIRFQIAAFRWDHDESGETKLEPTKDIVLFPALVTLKPGAQQRVRVGTTAQYGESEGSYRIYVEELPPPSGGASAGGAQVAMRTRLGIPVFLQPPMPTARVEVTDVTVDGGRMMARLRNVGNSHVLVDSVRFSGVSSGFERTAVGWYLLPGRSWVFTAPVTAAECRALSSLSVRAQVNGQPVTASGSVPAASCGGAP